MRLSFVIPAYNAAGSIGRTLESVVGRAGELPPGWQIEIVVVNDGSPDAAELERVVSGVPACRLLSHPQNRGMCAARNTGIQATTGDVVSILDADDEMHPAWPSEFPALLREWPAEANLCFAACRNTAGRVTSSHPGFSGLVRFEDMLAERYPGEYFPAFRGDYIRRRLYTDLGTRKSCGLLSYLSYSAEAPLWICNRVLRIYHDRRPGSVTSKWAQPSGSLETVRCYEAVIERFGEDLRRVSPRQYRLRMLRLAVYKAFAKRPDAWVAWRQGLGLSVLPHALLAAGLMVAGGSTAGRIVSAAKRVGLVKRYG